ncbi:MAG: glutamate--cysteine ligase [Candidatus Poseidoniales archaeon]
MNFLAEKTQLLEEKRGEIMEWFVEKRAQVPLPIYGSVDIRDADWKVAVVDANHFPAGFNNISPEDEPLISNLLREHINKLHEGCSWVHLYPESHTRNQAYAENVSTIKRLLEAGGFRCTVGSPELNGHGSIDTLSVPLKLVNVEAVDDGLLVDGEKPCLILLNNDLATGLVPGLGVQQVSPPPQMGWHIRRKSEHYQALQTYVDEMANLLNIDPWHLMSEWFVSEDKCLDHESCRIELAAEIDEFIARIKQRYVKLNIDREPVVFVKNDRGTYGLGILVITSGEQLLQLSNRKMKKLMYSKGGADVENFLIQEGVPTALKSVEGYPVEPVVYLVDGEAASWFYRINSKKGDLDNLNTPSSHFQTYSEVGEIYGKRAHGWHALVAELSMLAMGREAQIRENK